MTQVLPCLRVMHDLIEPDTDTNYLIELFSQQGIRANMVIDLIKSLHDRMKAHKPLFKSSKQVEWALEILGYSFLAPQYQYMRDDRNYLESILAVYEYMLCGQVDLEHEGKIVEFINIEATLDYKEIAHQRIMLKMLCHMTLLFDEKNFEKRFNPINGDVKGVEEDIKTPVRLCSLALKIYHKFLYRAYPFLAQEHWVTLIKVLIGLARFLLEPQYKVKLPEKVNIAVVELLYNTWILSGIQDEELWETFKANIHRLIYRSNVVSYWAEVCTELTSKLLTDQKCFEIPTLVILNDKKQMEFQKNLLIIYHAQQAALGDLEFYQKSKSLLPQPFIFRISRKQTIYLWSKMITLIQNGNFHHEPKIHSLILKGVSNVISLLLKTGAPQKTNSNHDTRNRSSTKSARKITIKHDFEYFKRTLKSLLLYDKVRPKGDNTLDMAPELETMTDIGGLTPSDNNQSFATAPEMESPILKKFKSAREKSQNFDFPQESGVFAKNQKAPCADFLLKLFGKLLFEGLDSSLTSSEEVRLTSITTLCQIFTKARGPFSTVYLKKFYRTYLQYLKEENFSNTLQTLLKHSCHLFKSITTSDSIIIQIPLLKKLLNYYYNGGKSEAFMQDSTLRGPSNKLYSSLICQLMNNSMFIDQAYSQERNIIDILHDLLNHALQRDKEALLCGRYYARTLAKETKNLARSSWNFMIYSFARKKISPFIANINDLWLDKSLPTLNKLTLDIFQTLAELCLTNVSTFKTDDAVNDTAFAGFMIAEKINTFLQQRLPQPYEVKKPTSLTSLENEEARNLASYALLVLYSWTLLLLYFKNRFNSINKREFYSTFATTMATLQAFSKQDPFSIHVHNILEMITGNLGNLNCTRNLPFTGSTLLNGEDEEARQFSKLSKELEEQSLVHLAPNEDTVLSFYDFNVKSADESLVIIARNISGKSVWSGNLFYKLPYAEKDNELLLKAKKAKESLTKKYEGLQDIKAQFARLGQLRKEKYIEKDLRKESLKSDDEGVEKVGTGQKQQASSADLRKAMEAQFDEEELYEEQFLKGEVEKYEASPRGRSQSAQDRVVERLEFGGNERLGKISSIKMLLSNAGLLSMSNIDDLVYIPKSKETFDWFRQIDQISTRTQIQANILYVADTSVDSVQELNPQDNIFNGFVDDLGLVINSESLELGAFETVREHINQYGKIVYASNVLYEFIFTITNMINSESAERKILDIPITIVWNARLSDSHDKSVPMIINKLKIKDYRTAIIITPLVNGSYLIDVLKQESTFCLFPQLKGFVCGRDLLSNIVLQAVSNLYREYQVYSEQLSYLDVSIGNLAQRKKNMSALVAHYKTRSDSSEALKALLGSTRIDLDSPSFKGK